LKLLFQLKILVELTIPPEKEDSDQLNYLAGKRLSEVKPSAEQGTILVITTENIL